MALTLWMQMESAQTLRGSNRPTHSSLKDGWKPSFKACLSETAAGEYGCFYTNMNLFALFAVVLKAFKKERRSCCNNCANLNGVSRWVASPSQTHSTVLGLRKQGFADNIPVPRPWRRHDQTGEVGEIFWVPLLTICTGFGTCTGRTCLFRDKICDVGSAADSRKKNVGR